MRNKFFLSIAIVGIVFASCQKEVSFGDNGGTGGGGGGGTTGDLLAKIVTKEGADSTVIEYEYDAAKRLIREKISGISQGSSIENDLRIVRNGAGIITHTIQKTPDLIAQGIDSAVTRVNYNTGTQRYTSRVVEISLFGISVIDSTVFVYDGAGKIIREDDYLYNPAFGALPLLSVKTEYVNGASGITQTNINYSDPSTGGPFELLATYKNTYDTKVSPLILPAGEAAAIVRMDFSATANATKVEYTDVKNGSNNNYNLVIAYTYNSKNKPLTAIITQTPGNAVSNSTFYYK